jgi:hypothetical protein
LDGRGKLVVEKLELRRERLEEEELLEVRCVIFDILIRGMQSVTRKGLQP